MGDMSNLTAVVLAGGLGTRLRSVVKDQPKVLAEIAGRPFLSYLLEQLARWRIEEVVLCIGYLGGQIESQFGRFYSGLRLIYSPEPMPLGTAGAVRSAVPFIGTETVLVLNGDSYCEANFDAFWQWHCLKGSAATMLLVNSPNTERFGRVRIAADGRITRFDEKKNGAEPGLINAGIYLTNINLLRSLPETNPLSLEREVFPSWIGQNFYGFQTDSSFLDIGTPESYALAEDFFAKFVAS